MSTRDPVSLGLLGPGTGIARLEGVVPLPNVGGHIRAGGQMFTDHHGEGLTHPRYRRGVGGGPIGTFHPVAVSTEPASHPNLVLDDASGIAVGVNVTGRGGEDLHDLVSDETEIFGEMIAILLSKSECDDVAGGVVWDARRACEGCGWGGNF